MKELEKRLRSLLKGEHTILHIDLNQHKASYVTTEEAVANDEYDWVSEDEKQKAIDTDSIWTIQWYPDTPIGFYTLAASSLETVINAALGEGKE